MSANQQAIVNDSLVVYVSKGGGFMRKLFCYFLELRINPCNVFHNKDYNHENIIKRNFRKAEKEQLVSFFVLEKQKSSEEGFISGKISELRGDWNSMWLEYGLFFFSCHKSLFFFAQEQQYCELQ